MALEINIKPEDIERMVKDSIMQAGFGAAVTKAIAGVFGGYNNPVEAELKTYVAGVCRELIKEKYADQIRAAVAKHIEATVTEEIIEKTTSGAVKKMVDAASDRY